MGIFEHLPYTNNHNLNLDWIIERIEEFSAAFETYEQTFANMSAQFDTWEDDFADMQSTFTQMQTDLNTWKNGIESDLADWKGDTESDLAAWKNNTESDITDWEEDTAAALDSRMDAIESNWVSTKAAWLQQFTTQFNAWEDQFEATYQEFINNYLQTLGVTQTSGSSTTDVMSQKAVTDVLVVESEATDNNWQLGYAIDEDGDRVVANKYRCSTYIPVDIDYDGDISVKINQAYVTVKSNQFTDYQYPIIAYYTYNETEQEYEYLSHDSSNAAYEGYYNFTIPATATHFRINDYDSTGVFEHVHKMSCRYVLFPAVAKATLDAHTEQINNKADKDGTYLDLTAGNAQQLLSDSGTRNDAVYVERDLPVETNRVRMNKLTGASVVWNQMVQDGNFPSNTTKWTLTSSANASVSYADNVATITALTSGSGSNYSIRQTLRDGNGNAISFTVGHKYLIKFDVYPEISGIYAVDADGSSSGKSVNCTASQWNNCAVIFTAAYGTGTEIYLIPTVTQTEGATIKWRNVQIHDLSIMSGSTVAAVMTSSIFNSYFPDDYYAYTPVPKIISSKVSAKKYYDDNNTQVSSYTMPDDKLRGILTVSGGKIVANGDTDSYDGTKTTKYALVDMGDLEWSYYSAVFYAILTDKASSVLPSSERMLCDAYVTISGQSGMSPSDDKVIYEYAGGTSPYTRICVRDDSYNGNAIAFKTAMSGRYLLYPLETPTASTSDTFRQLQISDPEGTEKYVGIGVDESGNTVLSSFISGSETEYLEDLRSKIEDMPDAATVDEACDNVAILEQIVPLDTPTGPAGSRWRLEWVVGSGAAGYGEWVRITE